MIGQILQVIKLASMFPIYCTIYMINPGSLIGQFMKKPFVKFITHSASYMVFLCKNYFQYFIRFKNYFFKALLCAASQRVEFLLLEWFGNSWIHELLEEWKIHERGALPGLAESACMIYIISTIKFLKKIMILY